MSATARRKRGGGSAPNPTGAVRPQTPSALRGTEAKRLIITADDFGLSESINEGVERGHREGVLTSASLMVAAPAAADAVRRAKAMPNLRVGLHLVVIEGPSVLPASRIHDLVDANGQFPRGQLRFGVNYAFSAAARRQLADEIRAQFEAYAATGLALDHADAHKHMHLHPVVGKLMVDIDRGFGLRAVRVPAEPPTTIARCGMPTTLGGRALYAWSGLLRRRACRAGMTVAGAVFGVAWSGHMTAARLKRLIANLPAGISEIYCHPAAWRDAAIATLMPDYEHEAELAALIDPDLRTMLQRFGIVAGGYGDFA